MKNKELFSQKALERLRSPEQLDVLLKVTNPISWMAVTAVGVLIFSAVLWSVFGVMAAKVDTVGMIIDSAGVANVYHLSTGRVKEILVDPGMHVKKGDVIAILEDPSQESQAMIARYNMGLAASGRETMDRVSQYNAKNYENEINKMVISSHDGIVSEIKVNKGDIINAGSSVCSVRLNQKRDEIFAAMYVSLTEGKRIKPGMLVQLAPNGVDTSEAGSLMGIVRSVSEYPVSSAAMNKLLGNQEVVNWILQKTSGAAIEVRVEIVKNEKSASGYLWSSVVGTQAPVTAGSTCTGSVVVDSKPPIEKVFYKISQWLRSR